MCWRDLVFVCRAVVPIAISKKVENKCWWPSQGHELFNVQRILTIITTVAKYHWFLANISTKCKKKTESGVAKANENMLAKASTSRRIWMEKYVCWKIDFWPWAHQLSCSTYCNHPGKMQIDNNGVNHQEHTHTQRKTDADKCNALPYNDTVHSAVWTNSYTANVWPTMLPVSERCLSSAHTNQQQQNELIEFQRITALFFQCNGNKWKYSWHRFNRYILQDF